MKGSMKHTSLSEARSCRSYLDRNSQNHQFTGSGVVTEMPVAQDSVREAGSGPSYLTLILYLEQFPGLDRVEADVLRSPFQF